MFVFLFSCERFFILLQRIRNQNKLLCLCLLISGTNLLKIRCVRYCYLLCKSAKQADYYIQHFVLGPKCDVAVNGFCSILPFWFVQYWRWRQTGSSRWSPACHKRVLCTCWAVPRSWWSGGRTWTSDPTLIKRVLWLQLSYKPDSLLGESLAFLKLLPHLFSLPIGVDAIKASSFSLERRWSIRRFPFMGVVPHAVLMIVVTSVMKRLMV